MGGIGANCVGAHLLGETESIPYPELSTTPNPVAQQYAPVQLVTVAWPAGTKRTATREVEVGANVFEERLLEEVQIERSLQNAFWGFLSPTTIQLRWNNVDNALTDLILCNADPRGSLVTIERWDAIVGGSAVHEATGRISGFTVGDSVVAEVAVEPPQVLLTPIPRETITVQKFPKATDLGFAIPVLFGNVKKAPLAYIFFDLTANVYIYLVSYSGVTPTNVYRQGVLVDPTEYTIYDGTYNNSVGGVGGDLRAYCVVVFTTEQREFNGRVYARKENQVISADVTGLQPERNFARAIRSILSNATWGLGQTVDSTTFDAAEADLTAIGNLFCDGWLLDQRPAKEYLDQLALVRGLWFDQSSAGAWRVYLDKAATDYAAQFGYNDGVERGGRGFNNLIERPERRFIGLEDSISALDCEYRYDDFSRAFLAVTSSRTVRTTGQPRRFSLEFVRDATTADKIADFVAQKYFWLGEEIDTVAALEARNLSLGDRVVIWAPDYECGDGYEVRGMTRGMTTFRLNLSKYSHNPYTYVAGTLPADAQEDAGADLSHSPPAAPSGLTKSSQGTEQASDGATKAWFDLSWTASTTAGVRYIIQIKKNGEAATAWMTWDETAVGVTTTRLRHLEPGLAYDIRVFARSQQNLDSLTSTSLTNQLAPGDTTAPSAPSAIAVRQAGGKSVEIEGTFTPPADWGTTILYRNTTNNSGTATEIDRGKKKNFHDQNVSYGTTYYYWLKVVDLSGNTSGFSPSSSHSVAVVQLQTGDLSDNSVTVIGVYSNSASVSLDIGDGNVEIGTITVSTSGGSVVLLAKCRVNVPKPTSGDQVLGIFLHKNSVGGTELDHGVAGSPDATIVGTVTILSEDVSPGSSQTYKLVARVVVGAETCQVSQRRIVALYRKK